MDTANLQAIADTLEFHYPRIITDLDCGVLPTVNVHFYSDHAALASAVASVVPNLPSWASGLAISETQIHMMSPNLQNGANYPWIMSILTHEFAHCASLHVNSSIANRPRWLWESVAIYESRQFVDPSAIAYLVEGDPPSLSELNSFNNTKVYDVGYLIAEYIVTEFGYPTLKMLIQNNGDIGTTLGKNADQFQQDWFQFVKTKYGI